ncbi:hypothetical protein AJ80_09195 [Polytolypa hystricis UAMH7299]|uniref:Uncharacterized protein n=1 Tax=Polytolypa hystricis (strain UAMH7299) TaxID=1447883 RepID=A0A2B7WUW5_POLH7|nr:hypothetical protein AJ80_09195 [Polytolypa hystricis UAMH7299]
MAQPGVRSVSDSVSSVVSTYLDAAILIQRIKLSKHHSDTNSDNFTQHPYSLPTYPLRDLEDSLALGPPVVKGQYELLVHRFGDACARGDQQAQESIKDIATDLQFTLLSALRSSWMDNLDPDYATLLAASDTNRVNTLVCLNELSKRLATTTTAAVEVEAPPQLNVPPTSAHGAVELPTNGQVLPHSPSHPSSLAQSQASLIISEQQHSPISPPLDGEPRPGTFLDDPISPLVDRRPPMGGLLPTRQLSVSHSVNSSSSASTTASISETLELSLHPHPYQRPYQHQNQHQQQHHHHPQPHQYHSSSSSSEKINPHNAVDLSTIRETLRENNDDMQWDAPQVIGPRTFGERHPLMISRQESPRQRDYTVEDPNNPYSLASIRGSIIDSDSPPPLTTAAAAPPQSDARRSPPNALSSRWGLKRNPSAPSYRSFAIPYEATSAQTPPSLSPTATSPRSHGHTNPFHSISSLRRKPTRANSVTSTSTQQTTLTTNTVIPYPADPSNLYLPNESNDYAGFCKGAWKLQNDMKKAMRVDNRPEGIYTRTLFWRCSKCLFEGPMMTTPVPRPSTRPSADGGPGFPRTVPAGEPGRSFDVTVRIHARTGIQYRWAFLAKSHIPSRDVPMNPDGTSGAFGCIYCVAADRGASPVFGDLDSFMTHLRSHDGSGRAPERELLDRTRCIMGRVAGKWEEFDLNVPREMAEVE